MGSNTTIQEIIAAIVAQQNDREPAEYDCLSISFSMYWDGSLSNESFHITDISEAVARYYSEYICPVRETHMTLESFDHQAGTCRLRVDLRFTRTPGTVYVAYPFLPLTEQSEIRYYC